VLWYFFVPAKGKGDKGVEKKKNKKTKIPLDFSEIFLVMITLEIEK